MDNICSCPYLFLFHEKTESLIEEVDTWRGTMIIWNSLESSNDATYVEQST